jgi:hypothetical protein
VPIVIHTIFVQRLFHSIFIYIPSSGELRRVRLTHGEIQRFTLPGNRSELHFGTSGTLFDTEFYSLIGMFLLCDKKQRHSGFDRAVALAICQRARTQLFGDIGRSFIPWPIIPDEALFGERKVRGALFSIQTSPDPLLFVTSGDLRGLPFELMFSEQLVLRCSSLIGLGRRPDNQRVLKPQVTVCRFSGDPDRLMSSAIRRSVEIIQRVLEGCGSENSFVPRVDERDRRTCLPFPLFSSNTETQSYATRFPFLEVIDVTSDVFPHNEDTLYVFTYSDLCEMPLMIDKLLRECPFAYHMFIPAQFVREAFQLMIHIYERHEKRKLFIEKIESLDSRPLTDQFIVASVSFDFVTLLQGTLIKLLGCPIALITYG